MKIDASVKNKTKNTLQIARLEMDILVKGFIIFYIRTVNELFLLSNPTLKYSMYSVLWILTRRFSQLALSQ